MKNTYISALILLAVVIAGFFLLKGTKPREEQASPMPQGKISIDTVCRTALTYMTFVNSNDAEIFIAECVEGKHPEVIQRYVDGLGLNGANI